MKKYNGLLALLAICFSFAACSDNDDDPTIYYAHPSEGLPSTINLTDARYLLLTRNEGSREMSPNKELKPYLFKYTTQGNIEPVRALYSNGINAQFSISDIIAISDQHYVASIEVDKRYLVMIDRKTGQIYKQEGGSYGFYKENLARLEKAYSKNKYFFTSSGTYSIDEEQHKINKLFGSSLPVITELKDGVKIIDIYPQKSVEIDRTSTTITLDLGQGAEPINLETEIVDLLRKFSNQGEALNPHLRFTADFFSDKEGNAYLVTHPVDENNKRYFTIFKAELKADKSGFNYTLADKVDVSEYFAEFEYSFMFDFGYNKYNNCIDFYPLVVKFENVNTSRYCTASFSFDTQKITLRDLDSKMAESRSDNLINCVVNEDYMIMRNESLKSFVIQDRKDYSVQALDPEGGTLSFYEGVSLDKSNFYINPTSYFNVRSPYITEMDITRENLWKETKIDFDNDKAKKELNNQEVYKVYNLQ